MPLEVVIKEHAIFEAERRGITEEFIRFVVKTPQQKLPAKKGRIIIQNKYYDKMENKEMLIRVIGIEKFEKFIVITAYKTSKINKYWKEER
ncbi:MAG: DUF4258 domain-containing protein [Nitrospinae bacterium]|nr:DUF4258 domain-containing protein [Nitrospinota bacterium]